jgi:serine protease AprX
VTRFVGRLGAGAAFGLAVVLSVGGGAATASTDRIDVIVRGTSAEVAVAAIDAVGGTVTFALPIVNGAAASMPADALEALEAETGIIDVVENAPIVFQHDDDDDDDDEGSSEPRSVFVREIKADRLWDDGIDGAGVRVAIIDTGVSAVPDLADRLISVPHPTDPSGTAACVDFSGELSCEDSYGHGTFIAGLIAGTGASSDGEHRGVAPGAEIVSIKIAGADGSADVTKVLAAIQWVVSFREELGIRVLNLSLGTNSPVSYRFDPLNFAVERAWRAGITVVVSASNRGPAPGTISKPADDPLVLTTGAVDDRGTTLIWDDRMPRFSGRGPTATDGLAKPDIVAPGARVTSLRSPGSTVEAMAPGGGVDETYRRGSGTSMSAGIVSGSVALMLQENPSWTPDRVKFALMSTARMVATTDRRAIGSGLIDVHRAVTDAPKGLANQNVFVLSDGTGSIEDSRGDVRVRSHCTDQLEKTIMPSRCDLVQDMETAQGRMFDSGEYREEEWTGSSWYSSQWNWALGSSWYGSSWYGSSWYGSSWYGSSWYGHHDEDDSYGIAILGSSWYGAWE